MAVVLLVDDDDTYRCILRRWLVSKGHEVIEASNGRIGIEQCHKSHPDVVVTDVFMPEADGLEMSMDVVASQCAKGVIVLSGGGKTMTGECFLEYAKGLGANEAFQKPVDKERFLAAVASIAES